MIITRLDPPIRVYVNLGKPKGWIQKPALCYAWVDYCPDSETHWRVCFSNGGAWYDVPGRYVRGVENLSQGRTKASSTAGANDLIMWVTMDGNLKAWFNRDCDPNDYRDGFKWVRCED